MIPTIVWTQRVYVYRDNEHSITHLKGYKTIGCQCHKDCTCAKDNFQRHIEKFRVSGKNRRHHIPKPFDFDTLEQAKERITKLKQT